MAERSGRDGLSRRSSFRKTVLEGSLPPKFLDALEQKRKQLDESIHKYIASKEREYKQFEKDLRTQCTAGDGQDQQGTATETVESTVKRRTSSESTQDAGLSSLLNGQAKAHGQGMSAVDALLANGTGRDVDSHAVQEDESLALAEQRATDASLADRRVSKDFVGLFTPQFLPAIDGKDPKNGPRPERTESAPAMIEPSSRSNDDTISSALPRIDSDPAGLLSQKADVRRPMHLQLNQRTSSSGSSADGKLASAMKSPTHALQRPKRKRVSLAVGDSIVAPSEEVPPALDHHSTPSHSRTRSPASEQDGVPNVPNGPVPTTVDDSSMIERIEDVGDAIANQKIQRIDMQPSANLEPAPAADPDSDIPRSSSNTRASSKPSIDPDGDLFDLEEEEAGLALPHDISDAESALGSEEDGITGRIERDDHEGLQMTPSSLQQNEPDNYEYDPEAGLIPEPALPVTETVDDEDTAVHLEFGPGSAGASQQPTKPGFRRPSVITDPVFRGSSYDSAEANAVEDDVYGSSFARPASKGSFTAGSLGGSYMARHAEEMMKLRTAKREQEVRT